LAIVVLYTNRGAFFSPVAVLVVAAIGLAAVLLQVRFYNRERPGAVKSPVWLNSFGSALALIAVFTNAEGWRPDLTQLFALGAVASFGVSGAISLHAMQKRTAQK
jgi:uncharacterized membrane protein